MKTNREGNQPVIIAAMEVEDIVREHPAAVPVLTRLGVVCIQCGAPVWGTLAEAVESAGLDLDDVLTQVNAALDSD